MAVANKIDSNQTGLRYQEELCVGQADPANNWIPLEPNSYDDFGGEITTVARNPINASRQRQKGVVTDLDASGGFNTDVTQTNLQDILQGFFFADFRRKSDVGVDRNARRPGIAGEFADYLVTDVGAADDITVDSRVAVSIAINVAGTGYADGDIVTITDAAATIEVKGIINQTGGIPDTVTLTDPVFSGGDEGRSDADLAGPSVTTVAPAGGSGLTVTITYGDGISWQAGDLVWSQGHTQSDTNGLLSVLSVSDNVITFNETLTADAAPAVGATLTTVGTEAGAGEFDVITTGDFSTITSSGVDWTTLGLVPGEWIFVGGDLAADAFATPANNGFKRIRSITAANLVIDKSNLDMIAEPTTTETVQIFFGRVLKNESDPTLQVRRSYQLERTLGAPDLTLPAEIQAEYIVGSVANELTFNFGTADKITADVGFVSTDSETIDGPTSLKAGSRPALVSGDAFNTSADIKRLRLAVHSSADEAPTPLFSFLTEFSVVINNGIVPNKAISVLGAFDVTASNFEVDGDMTAYFSDVAALASIRNNDDITLDFSIVGGSTGAKSGISVDVPLIALGDGRPDVEQDSPITLPLDTPAAADRLFNHTLLMVFYDFLPNAADT